MKVAETPYVSNTMAHSKKLKAELTRRPSVVSYYDTLQGGSIKGFFSYKIRIRMGGDNCEMHRADVHCIRSQVI